MLINTEKPVRTKGGHKVRILCTDSQGGYPIVGLVTNKHGSEIPYCWNYNGVCMNAVYSDLDIINIPENSIKNRKFDA